MVDKRIENPQAPERNQSAQNDAKAHAAAIQRQLLESQPDGASAGQTFTSRTDASSGPDKVAYGDAQKLVGVLQRDNLVAPPRDASRVALPRDASRVAPPRDASRVAPPTDAVVPTPDAVVSPPVGRYNTLEARDVRASYYDSLTEPQRLESISQYSGLVEIKKHIEDLNRTQSSLDGIHKELQGSLQTFRDTRKYLDDRSSQNGLYREQLDTIRTNEGTAPVHLPDLNTSSVSSLAGRLKELSTSRRQLTVDWIDLQKQRFNRDDYTLGDKDLSSALDEDLADIESKKEENRLHGVDMNKQMEDVLRQKKEVQENLQIAKETWFDITSKAGKGKKQDSE